MSSRVFSLIGALMCASLVACSGAENEPSDAGGDSGAEATIDDAGAKDGGADSAATPDADCPFPNTNVNGPNHLECEPAFDSLCPPPKDVCGSEYSHHYICHDGNTPAGSHDDAGVSNDFNCITLDSADFCCKESACTHADTFVNGCTTGNAYACAYNAQPPSNTCQGVNADQDSGVETWCCQ